MDGSVPKPRFLTKKEVKYLTTLAYATIDRLEKAGLFPIRRQLSDGRVAWLESEVIEWMMAKV
jgi:prophage regulatory protein